MRFVMNPDMVYQYPIWAVGLLLVGAAVLGAALPNRTHAPSLLQNTRLSSNEANPLSRSLN